MSSMADWFWVIILQPILQLIHLCSAPVCSHFIKSDWTKSFNDIKSKSTKDDHFNIRLTPDMGLLKLDCVALWKSLWQRTKFSKKLKKIKCLDRVEQSGLVVYITIKNLPLEHNGTVCEKLLWRVAKMASKIKSRRISLVSYTNTICTAHTFSLHSCAQNGPLLAFLIPSISNWKFIKYGFKFTIAVLSYENSYQGLLFLKDVIHQNILQFICLLNLQFIFCFTLFIISI